MKFIHSYSVCLIFALVFADASAFSQTAPTPETTFTNSADTAWGTAGNWDNGIPTAASVPSNALIQAGLTVAASEADDSGPPFGTLTLGVGSTFEFIPTTSQTGPDRIIYFADGSHFKYTSGSSNRDDDWVILPGADATNTFNGLMKGTCQGTGNLTVFLQGDSYIRKDFGGLTGNLTFLSNNGSSARSVTPTSYAADCFSQATNTVGHAVNLLMSSGNRIPDPATVKLVGGVGADRPKMDMGGNSETIANLICDSPVSLTGARPLFKATSGRLTVADTVTFQGTASTVELDDSRADASLATSDLVFDGTNDWILIGNAGLDVSGALTTTTNAAINNPLSGDFTKAGSATLTLGDPNPISVGSITVSEGALAFTNSSSVPIFRAIAVTNSGTLDLDYAGTGTVLYLTFDGSVAAPGVWGRDGSSAPNTTNLITSDGLVLHKNGTVDNIFYWDGGDTNNPSTGDLTSGGGNGSWNTTTQNWDIGYAVHTAWGNTTNDKAIFAGSAGTVTLSEDVNIGELEISTDNYTITGSTLIFADGGSITMSSGTGGNWAEVLSIASAISNSPSVILSMAGNTESVFAPAAGTVSLGTVSGGGLIQLDGSTTGNTIAGSVNSKIRVSGGEWTLTGTASAYQHFGDGGTLIVEGTLISNDRDLKISDGHTIVVNGTYGNGNGNGLIFSGNTEGFSGSPGGILKGTGLVNQTELLNIRSEATIAPGYPTGTLTITNTACTITGTLAIEVNGAQNSHLAVYGALSVSNAALSVNVSSPPANDLVIATANSVAGRFAVTNAPGGWDVDYAYMGGNAIALIPPASGTVLIIK